MIELIEAVKEIIDQKVVGLRHLRAPATKGQTYIKVAKALLYVIGETVVIRDKAENKAEVHKIACIPDGLTLQLCEPLQCNYETTAIVRKVYGGEPIRSYLGTPPEVVLPAITVDLKERDQVGLALGGMYQDTYSLIVGVWVNKQSFDASFRAMHQIVKIVEGSLFTTIYPLVAPYLETTLKYDVSPSDTAITVVDPTVLTTNMDFYLDSDEKSTYHRTTTNNGNGNFSLVHFVGHYYAAGSRVYSPLIHTYDAQVAKVNYDDPRQGSAMLKRANMTYTVKIARARRAV